MRLIFLAIISTSAFLFKITVAEDVNTDITISVTDSSSTEFSSIGSSWTASTDFSSTIYTLNVTDSTNPSFSSSDSSGSTDFTGISEATNSENPSTFQSDMTASDTFVTETETGSSDTFVTLTESESSDASFSPDVSDSTDLSNPTVSAISQTSDANTVPGESSDATGTPNIDSTASIATSKPSIITVFSTFSTKLLPNSEGTDQTTKAADVSSSSPKLPPDTTDFTIPSEETAETEIFVSTISTIQPPNSTVPSTLSPNATNPTALPTIPTIPVNASTSLPSNISTIPSILTIPPSDATTPKIIITSTTTSGSSFIFSTIPIFVTLIFQLLKNFLT